MTACVNKKHTGKVAAVVTASLVGALSLGVAPVAAMAAGSETPGVENAFSGNDFTWSVQPNKDGEMVVPAGTPLTLENIVDWQTKGEVPLEAVTVYYTADDSSLKDEPITNPGSYKAIVVLGNYEGYTTLASLKRAISADDLDYDKISYEMDYTVEAKSLKGAYAYENGDIEDTSFMFTGNKLAIAFADSSNEKLEIGTDVNVSIQYNNGSGEVTDYNSVNILHAGTYHVNLAGVSGGDYAGQSVNFDIKVGKINLDEAEFSFSPVKKGTDSSDSSFSSGKLVKGDVYVDGNRINIDAIDVEVTGGWVTADGVDWDKPIDGFAGLRWGRVNLEITAESTTYKNDFEGDGPAESHVFIVKDLVQNYYYDDDPVAEGDTLRFEAGDAAFDPSKVTAAVNPGGDDLGVDVTVKDAKGNVLPADYDYTQPGTYTVTATVEVDESTFALGGTRTFTVMVVGKRFPAKPQVFAAIDGKSADGAEVEYDAKAVVPSIVVKAGSAVLTAGEDYTVAYLDAEGNAVEEMTEPGDYTVVIDYGNSYFLQNGDYTTFDPTKISFTITKADIDSAKADAEFYKYTGETIKPTFTAYTNDNLTGLSVAVDAGQVNLTYHKVKTGSDGKPLYETKLVAVTDDDTTYFRWEKVLQVEDAELQASDLVDAGWYVADVYVSNEDPHFTGTCQSEPFEVVSDYATFSDVDASAWYADSVYSANDLGYMTGIKGTDLFMPLADISRAELSQVFFNMAGNSSDTERYYPTAFADVDGHAWYAQPVAWASEAGIVTGYDADTFGPMDKATREQVAVMLYRYAKAQGKDVSVENADETLAKYKDADQVADWAKDAMAWAVDNGIFGVGTDELWAKQNIQRAAVATIAVRFQPEALPEA